MNYAFIYLCSCDIHIDRHSLTLRVRIIGISILTARENLALNWITADMDYGKIELLEDVNQANGYEVSLSNVKSTNMV